MVRNKFDLHCNGVSDVDKLERSPTPRLRGTGFNPGPKTYKQTKISPLYTLERCQIEILTKNARKSKPKLSANIGNI